MENIILSKAFLILIYVLIFICLCKSSESIYKWEGDIINYREDIENIKTNEEPLKYAEYSISKLYYLRIRIVNKNTGIVCKSCNRQVMRVGGKPNIVSNLEKPDDPNLNGLITFGNVIRGKYEWYYPFITNEVGIDFLVIESNELLPYDLVKDGVDSHFFAIIVYWDIYKTLHLIKKYNIRDSIVQLRDIDISQVEDIDFYINQSFSPFAFGVLKNYKTPTALILSINRKSLELVEFENESLNKATGGKLNEYRILSGIFDTTKIILNTSNGLLIGSWKPKYYNNTITNSTEVMTNINWSNANLKDITKVDYDTQEPHLDKEKCNVTFVFDIKKHIYVIYGESTTEAEELLDKKKRTLYDALNIPYERIKLISGTLSKEFCNRYNMEWNFIYRLGVVDTRKQLPYIITNGDLSGNFKLKLIGMTFQHSTSNELYLYGNALIVSSNGGYTFNCIDIFNERTDGMINKFRTNDGSYAFSTTKNDIWFGNSNYGRSVKILNGRDSPYKNFPFYSINPIYIENSKLKVIEMYYDTTLNFNIRDVDIYNSLNKYASKNELICPYKYISIKCNKDPEIVRVNLDNKDSYLPHHIYLEKHEFYNFSVTVYPEDNFDIENSDLMFSLNNFDNTKLSINKNIDRINRKIDYDVSIHDQGNIDNQYEPGKNLELSNLKTTFNNLNYKCLLNNNPNEYSSDIE
eukprot:jgi/Orpsp1_1/1182277/evm.model.c7180000080612.1